jgi:hypothetical protein
MKWSSRGKGNSLKFEESGISHGGLMFKGYFDSSGKVPGEGL